MRRLVVGGVLPGQRGPVLGVVQKRVDLAVGDLLVVKTRSRVSSLDGQTASSRQSPNRSPDSDGTAFVPLLECTPDAVSSRVSPDVPYLSTRVPSSSSRTGSASHQARKLIDDGLRPASFPVTPRSSETDADQNSAPGRPAQTSPATPRPLSQHAGVDHRTCPLRGSRVERGRLPGRLADLEVLQAGTRRVEVAEVLGVAVAGPGRPEAAAVVVHRHGAVDDLVAAVPVDVAADRLCEPCPS